MIAAALIVAATLTPTSGLSWVCPALDANPTESGVIEMLFDAVSQGYGTESGGRKIAVEIRNNCPEYIPLVLHTLDKIGG